MSVRTSSTPGRHLGRRGAAWSLLTGLGVLAAGCAGTSKPEPAGSPPVRPAGPIGSAVGSENGLEVRKLVLQDEDGTVGQTLREFGYTYSGEGAERLTRNGYLLVRVDAAEVDALLEALGAPLTDLRTWHGQAPDWRDLVRIPARQPLGAIVDGRPRVFEDGSLRLLLRAWTLPTEEGAVLELQLRAQFQPVARGVSVMLDPSTEEAPGQPVGGSAELHLGAGEAWILTCALPRDVAPAGDDDDVRRDGMPARAARGESAAAADGAAPQRTPPRGPVPDDVIGPGAALPPTLGAMLMSTDVPATRTLFLLLPKLPEVARPQRPELDPMFDGTPEAAPDGTTSDAEAPPPTAPSASTGAGESTIRGGER